MPFPNFHSARVRDPGDFDHVLVLKTLSNGIMIYGGPLKSNPKGSTETQTYRIPADKFTVDEAKKWLKDNDVKYISFEAATGSKDMGNAILKIYDDIGEDEGEISSAFVSEFLDQNKEATDITVRINSRGGNVNTGWAIHDLLTNSGKRIKTIGEGKIYSIATIVFLAGSEREIYKNAEGLIHNPFIPGENLSDSDYKSSDLLSLAEHMAQEESKILDFYVENTGSPKEKLAEYMKEDTMLSAEDMFNLGFATKIIEPVKAYAIYKLKNNIMEQNDVKTFGDKLDILAKDVKALFSRLPSKDQTLKDKDGKEFKLEKETGSPAVGDKASPDGTFVMASGKTIVIEAGVVKEVKEPTIAKTELELANEKIADLTKQLDAEKAKVTDAEKVKTEAEASKVAFEAEKVKATALVTELQGLKNSWKPDARGKFSSAEKVGEINLNQVRETLKKINTKSE